MGSFETNFWIILFLITLEFNYNSFQKNFRKKRSFLFEKVPKLGVWLTTDSKNATECPFLLYFAPISKYACGHPIPTVLFYEQLY